MVTQVNEIDNDRHISMSYIEFVEAIVRAIYKASPAPPRGDDDDYPIIEEHSSDSEKE
jgi:hypothetical protein